jgi:cell division protein FtsB
LLAWGMTKLGSQFEDFCPTVPFGNFFIWILFSCSFLQKEKDSLRKELQALKKENKLLKENNALANRKKEHYACEIKRLNKVPEQVKQGESTRKPQQEVVNHHRARATVRFLLLLLRMLSPVYTEHLATAYKPYLVRTL